MKLQLGDRVRHPVYGEGVVIDIDEGPFPLMVGFDSGDALNYDKLGLVSDLEGDRYTIVKIEL